MIGLATNLPPLSAAKKSSYKQTGVLYLHLYTIVEGLQWITVYKMPFKHLAASLVDNKGIKWGVYTQVIHTIKKVLRYWKTTVAKKKLDQLSTYPQSLLKLLSKKN